jgi:hypothetical protein
MQAKHKNTGRWEGVKPRLSHFQVYLTAKKCGPGYVACTLLSVVTAALVRLHRLWVRGGFVRAEPAGAGSEASKKNKRHYIRQKLTPRLAALGSTESY